MDSATRLAFGALVRVLHRREIIEEDEIAEMMNELADTAERQQRAGEAGTAEALLRLARDIGRDANIGE
ncbi:MAG TPA: hypothetical protein VGX37_04365 [Allosphingosinicella sp.]|jgi:transcription elongation GreA/GreB family factor|nr:hypothetical protein [Allosphingosinicella sp.]